MTTKEFQEDAAYIYDALMTNGEVEFSLCESEYVVQAERRNGQRILEIWRCPSDDTAPVAQVESSDQEAVTRECVDETLNLPFHYGKSFMQSLPQIEVTFINSSTM